MTALVLAALSARLLAQAARGEGFQVVVLDAFGDADTLAACQRWESIAQPGSLRIDPDRFAAAMLGIERSALGWVAGAGFEARPQLLDHPALPLLGNARVVVEAVRDPRRFFAQLDRLRIAYPEVSHRPPAPGLGWLVKHAGGSGGQRVWRARRQPRSPSVSGDPWRYWQREVVGTPGSACVIADGRQAVVVGLQRQSTLALGAQPFTWAGTLGPLRDVAPPLRHTVQAWADALTAAYGLRGWLSLDFIVDPSGKPWLLELNARPGASLMHYRDWGPIVHAHLQACLEGTLPTASALARWRAAPLTAQRVVVAAGATTISAATLHMWAERTDVHDRPSAPLDAAAGQPLCTVSAGARADETVDALEQRIERLATGLLQGPP